METGPVLIFSLSFNTFNMTEISSSTSFSNTYKRCVPWDQKSASGAGRHRKLVSWFSSLCFKTCIWLFAVMTGRDEIKHSTISKVIRSAPALAKVKNLNC